MFCTVCEIIIDEIKHYKTTMHAINLKRKLEGYPPLSAEELDSEVMSEGFAIDLNHEHEVSEDTISCGAKHTHKVAKKVFCMFCDQPESPEHYLEHGLSVEQVTYISRRQCYVCYERFISKDLLLKHLENDVHRTAVSDGSSLYLDNGKVLHPVKRSMEIAVAPIPAQRIKRDDANVITPEGRFLDQKRLEKLKVGMHMANEIIRKPF